jgi:hypothetical protein
MAQDESKKPEIDPGSVEELLATVKDLLKDESDRATSLNGRGSGLTGFIGVILSLAAATGAALGRDAGASLHPWVRIAVGVLVVLALVALGGAVIAVVAKVLIPTEGITIATREAKQYPTWSFISRERVMIQGHVMRGYVGALERDRKRNASKATWLGRGYKLVTVGLIAIGLAGAIATIDRYVAGRSGTGDNSGVRTHTRTTRHDRQPVHGR